MTHRTAGSPCDIPVISHGWLMSVTSCEQEFSHLQSVLPGCSRATAWIHEVGPHDQRSDLGKNMYCNNPKNKTVGGPWCSCWTLTSTFQLFNPLEMKFGGATEQSLGRRLHFQHERPCWSLTVTGQTQNM